MEECETCGNKNLKEGNISLIIASYNDIFSSFDPRPYSERALSDDFLQECKRATRDKKENTEIELKLLVPAQKRNYKEELLIKRRLIKHFEKHALMKEHEVRDIKRKGFFWITIGILIMAGATFLLARETFIFNFMLILAEPAGWFLFWEGLDLILMEAKEQKPEVEFYKKMAKIKLLFSGY